MQRVHAFFSSSLIRNGIISSVGNTAGTVIGALAIILLARLLDPAGFGDFSYVVAVMMVVVRLIDFGYSQTALNFLPKQESPESVLQTVIHGVTRTGSVVVGGGVVLLGILLLTPLNIPTPALLLLALAGAILLARYELFHHVLQATGRVWHSIALNWIQASLKLLSVGLLWLVGGLTASSAVILYILGPTLAILAVSRRVHSGMRERILSFFATFWHHNTEQETDIHSYARHAAIGLASGAVIENIGIIAVRWLTSAEQAGVFSGVYRIALFASLIGVYFSQVLYARVAEMEEPAELQQYWSRALWGAAAVIAASIVVTPFAEPVIGLILGGAYVTGGASLTLLLLAVGLQVATIPLTAVFFAGKVREFFSYTGILQLVVISIATVVLVPWYGAVGAAIAVLVTRLVQFVVAVGWGWRKVNQI